MADKLPTTRRLGAEDAAQQRTRRANGGEPDPAGELAGEGAPPLQDELLDHHDRWNHAVRGETPHQRIDRNYAELLQEVRIAQVGVQFLLAFLLTVAFTPRFVALTDFQRHVYVISVVLGAAATALLIAPAPFHRLVFQRRLKQQLVTVSSYFALFGLALLMLTLGSSLLLILDVVLDTRTALWATGGILAWFSLWWYVVPLWCRTPHGMRLCRRLASRPSGRPLPPWRPPMVTPPSDRPTRRRDLDNYRISDVDRLLNHAAADLTRRFDSAFGYETVRRCIGESYHLLAVNARIHAHLPLLAARFARERLQAAAKIPAATVSTTGEDLAGH
jgi:hypothetical protein